ncbi:unnamed protein product, partial [Polarella glacialis]
GGAAPPATLMRLASGPGDGRSSRAAAISTWIPQRPVSAAPWSSLSKRQRLSLQQQQQQQVPLGEQPHISEPIHELLDFKSRKEWLVESWMANYQR